MSNSTQKISQQQSVHYHDELQSQNKESRVTQFLKNFVQFTFPSLIGYKIGWNLFVIHLFNSLSYFNSKSRCKFRVISWNSNNKMTACPVTISCWLEGSARWLVGRCFINSRLFPCRIQGKVLVLVWQLRTIQGKGSIWDLFPKQWFIYLNNKTKNYPSCWIFCTMTVNGVPMFFTMGNHCYWGNKSFFGE